MNEKNFFIYLAVMAGVTYLIRMLPLVLMRKKIENRFLISFLRYIPYAVLSVMTVPAFLYATDFTVSACAGFAAAFILSYFEKSLLTTAAFSCITVFIAELIIKAF